ncbi:MULTISPECIES: ABC transporter substrate-binding protein [unclassified Afipia]|uniref:ABC transporter substrate-binding protein n=1 Tax=unclassified Afipia TaxID=2642050 RepID=UPI0004160572|nr:MULTISPECIES: ABC transporter substrate-binding protein [unclassified Afipia]
MRVLGRLMAASALGLLMAGGAHGQGISNGAVKIGVLGDMSGVFQDLSGASSVAAAKMAVDDFVKNEKPSFKVELVTSDHQNKPDIAVSRVREWYDVDGVDMVTDAINSAVALAVSGVTREKNRVLMVTGAGTTALINEQCSPNTILYAWDTYGISNALAGSITRSGKKNWYFLSVDYALGQAIEKDATRAIDAAGGKVVGSRKHPTGTADFSSFVLTAQNSGADVIGLANAGGDLINSVKAAQDFGITQKQTIAPMAATLMDIHAIGLASSQGLMLVEGFYWNRNDESRAWSERFFKERNRMPIMLQAGLYSAITTYLKAVKETGTDDAKTVLDHMKKIEINDLFAKGGRIRADGRMVYDMYVLAVKKPAESKKAWDYLEIRDTISGKDAYQPLSDSRCPLVKN